MAFSDNKGGIFAEVLVNDKHAKFQVNSGVTANVIPRFPVPHANKDDSDDVQAHNSSSSQQGKKLCCATLKQTRIIALNSL